MNRYGLEPKHTSGILSTFSGIPSLEEGGLLEIDWELWLTQRLYIRELSHQVAESKLKKKSPPELAQMQL